MCTFIMLAFIGCIALILDIIYINVVINSDNGIRIWQILVAIILSPILIFPLVVTVYVFVYIIFEFITNSKSIYNFMNYKFTFKNKKK